MEPTVAILLAAGESRRMATLKALLPWQGTTLLAHQVTALREAGVDLVVVVLGHQADRLKPIVSDREGVSWRLNPDYMRGKTTSIKAGLKALGPDRPSAVLILNVDQPRSPDTIRHLLQQHRAGERLITIPHHRGKGGHPIIVEAALLEELASIDEETLGMKAVVTRHQDSVLRVEMETPEVLWDLNTPEEYQAAVQGQV